MYNFRYYTKILNLLPILFLLSGCLGNNTQVMEKSVDISPMELAVTSINILQDNKPYNITIGAGMLNLNSIFENAIKMYLIPTGKGKRVIANIESAELFEEGTQRRETNYRIYAKVKLELLDDNGAPVSQVIAKYNDTLSVNNNLTPGQHYEVVQKWVVNSFARVVKELQNNFRSNLSYLVNTDFNPAPQFTQSLNFDDIKPIIVQDNTY